MSGKPGRGRPTISDVAKLAGVSIGTVSRVLNNVRNVQPALQGRVVAAVEALRYEPDVTAQSMRSKQTRVAGVIVPDSSNPLSAAALSGIEDELSDLGYTLFLANSRYDLQREERILQEFARRRVDGVIAMVAEDQETATAGRLQGLAMPVVLLERDMGPLFDAVRTDQVAGTYRATRYLLGLGHTRIGLVTVPETNMSGRHRARGFRMAFEDAECPVPEDLVRTEKVGRDNALEAAYAILIARDRPTAIIVSGGLLAGVLEAATQLHLAIPHQLSLLALGDTELAALMRPPITAIAYDWAATGRNAARLLVSRMSGGDRESRRIVIPYEFLLRGSCRPYP